MAQFTVKELINAVAAQVITRDIDDPTADELIKVLRFRKIGGRDD
jgi:hypothetical protein